MAKWKKLMQRAAELAHLPIPERSPAERPLTEPLDLLREFARAWDAKDAEAIGRLFVEDADYVNVVGLWWTGRRSIVKAHRFGFDSAFPGAKLTLTKVTQRVIDDHTAVVMARWSLRGQVDPEGEPVDPRRGVLSATVVRLADGTWLGVHCQNTDIALAADTNISRAGTLSATSYIKGPSVQEVANAELVDD